MYENQTGRCSFQGQYSDKEEERIKIKEYEYKVTFSQSYPYGKDPKVFIAVNLLDCDTNNRNTRIRVNAKNITNKSFVIRVESWSNSLTWRVDVTWFASIDKKIQIGQCRHNNLVGDRSSIHEGKSNLSKRLKFPSAFPNDGPIPSVAAFIKSLDVDSSGNTSVRINISDVDREGFTLDCSTWYDSCVWEVGCYWVASTSPTTQLKPSIGCLYDPKVFGEFSEKVWRTACKESASGWGCSPPGWGGRSRG